MPLAATAALTRKTVSATEIPVALTVFPIALTVSPVRRVGETGTTSEGSRGSPGGVPGDMNVAPTQQSGRSASIWKNVGAPLVTPGCRAHRSRVQIGSRGSLGGVPGDMNVAPTKDVASANPAAFRAAIPPVFLFAARR